MQVVILRGISGSGKSFYAQQLLKHLSAVNRTEIVSQDDFFTFNGTYRFDEKRIGEAAAACMTNFAKALSRKFSVIVDNTNTRLWEYQGYLEVARLVPEAGIEVHQITCRDLPTLRKFHARNVHGVPLHTIGQQFARWEDDPSPYVKTVPHLW